MKKDDNTTNYSARLVCEKCGYVFGLKEVAYIEHGFSEPWNSPRVEVKCYNEIYPRLCPKCKREAQQISYGNKLGVYCAKDKDEADIAIKKRTEEEIRNGIEKLRKLNTFKVQYSVTPAAATGILAYCNEDVNLPKCVDCDAVKDYCSVCEDCPQKDTLPADYFVKNGLYPCAVFPTLKNASDFADYMMDRLEGGCSPRICLMTVSNAVKQHNGFLRLHKAASDFIGDMPKVDEMRYSWHKQGLKTYGIAIDFEKQPYTDDRIFCVYLPSPSYIPKEGK